MKSHFYRPAKRYLMVADRAAFKGDMYWPLKRFYYPPPGTDHCVLVVLGIAGGVAFFISVTKTWPWGTPSPSLASSVPWGLLARHGVARHGMVWLPVAPSVPVAPGVVMAPSAVVAPSVPVARGAVVAPSAVVVPSSAAHPGPAVAPSTSRQGLGWVSWIISAGCPG